MCPDCSFSAATDITLARDVEALVQNEFVGQGNRHWKLRHLTTSICNCTSALIAACADHLAVASGVAFASLPLDLLGMLDIDPSSH